MDTKPQKRSPKEQEDLDTRLIDAADHGDTKAVQTLLAAGANVHENDDCALRLAADAGHTETVRVLLAAGADAHAEDDGALRWAADNGHTETVNVLFEAGSDVHAWDAYSLGMAAQNGHAETVQTLAKHIFAPESWRGKSRAEIEAHAEVLYNKIAHHRWNPIRPERLRQAGIILLDCALCCWEQVRPPPPLGFKISTIPAQPRPL